MDNAERKSRRGRYIEDQQFPMSIAELKKWGLLRMGQFRTRNEGGAVYMCDLTKEPFFFSLHLPGCLNQRIELIARKVGKGLRWFFKEEATGIVCTKLYLDKTKTRWVSRQIAGYAYRSQSKGKLDRDLAAARALRLKIEGGGKKGPARGNSRRQAQANLERVNLELENVRATLRKDAARRRRQSRKVGPMAAAGS